MSASAFWEGLTPAIPHRRDRVRHLATPQVCTWCALMCPLLSAVFGVQQLRKSNENSHPPWLVHCYKCVHQTPKFPTFPTCPASRHRNIHVIAGCQSDVVIHHMCCIEVAMGCDQQVTWNPGLWQSSSLASLGWELDPRKIEGSIIERVGIPFCAWMFRCELGQAWEDWVLWGPCCVFQRINVLGVAPALMNWCWFVASMSATLKHFNLFRTDKEHWGTFKIWAEEFLQTSAFTCRFWSLLLSTHKEMCAYCVQSWNSMSHFNIYCTVYAHTQLFR